MKNGLLALVLVSVSGVAYAQTSQAPAAPTPAAPATAQAPAARPASPAGSSQTQVAGSYGKDEKGREQ